MPASPAPKSAFADVVRSYDAEAMHDRAVELRRALVKRHVSVYEIKINHADVMDVHPPRTIASANTESMATTHTMVMMSSMRCCFLSALYFPVDDA